MAEPKPVFAAMELPRKDQPRLLYVMCHVGDVDSTIKFYTESFGMKLVSKRDRPEEYCNAFLWCGREESHSLVYLTSSADSTMKLLI